MQVIFIILFALTVIFHLYTCYFHIEPLRKLSKPLLLALLAIIYALYARQFSALVLIALLLGMTGDIFLIFPKRGASFMAGALAFAAGHVCYTAALHRFTDIFRMGGSTRWLWLIIIVYFAALYLVMRSLKTYMPRDKALLMPVYIGLICVFCTGALISLMLFGGLPLLLLWLSSVLFMTSDCMLCFETFKAETPHGNFYVMLTYIAAQSLLAAGFALI